MSYEKDLSEKYGFELKNLCKIEKEKELKVEFKKILNDVIRMAFNQGILHENKKESEFYEHMIWNKSKELIKMYEELLDVKED